MEMINLLLMKPNKGFISLKSSTSVLLAIYFNWAFLQELLKKFLNTSMSDKTNNNS